MAANTRETGINILNILGTLCYNLDILSCNSHTFGTLNEVFGDHQFKNNVVFRLLNAAGYDNRIKSYEKIIFKNQEITKKNITSVILYLISVSFKNLIPVYVLLIFALKNKFKYFCLRYFNNTLGKMD